MKSKKLFEALSYVDDRYLDMVDAPEKENLKMSDMYKRPFARKSVSFLIAAVICISILAVTAMAAGWIPGLFNILKERYPADEELFSNAARANTDAVPEMIGLSNLDPSQFILSQSYFDGKTILIGYNLDIILPEPIVGTKPDAELLMNIKNATPITSIAWDHQQNWLEDAPSENAVKHNLSEDASLMDRMLKGKLSDSGYQKVWEILERQGYVCIAVQNAWMADHILINGIDTVEAYIQSNAYCDRTEYVSEFGNCIRLEPLPEDVRNQEVVTVTLNVRSSVGYWYLDLDGTGTIYFDNSNIVSDPVSFELTRTE